MEHGSRGRWYHKFCNVLTSDRLQYMSIAALYHSPSSLADNHLGISPTPCQRRNTCMFSALFSPRTVVEHLHLPNPHRVMMNCLVEIILIRCGGEYRGPASAWVQSFLESPRDLWRSIHIGCNRPNRSCVLFKWRAKYPVLKPLALDDIWMTSRPRSPILASLSS